MTRVSHRNSAEIQNPSFQTTQNTKRQGDWHRKYGFTALLQIKDANLHSAFLLDLEEDTFGTELISNIFLPTYWHSPVVHHLPIRKHK